MTKKLSRRRVLPMAMEPNCPQSTWAHSPGANASVRNAGLRGGPNFADVLLDDADAAGVAGLAQLLEDLGRGVRVGLEQADDLALEVIEFAGPPGRACAGGTWDSASQNATVRRCRPSSRATCTTVSPCL